MDDPDVAEFLMFTDDFLKRLDGTLDRHRTPFEISEPLCAEPDTALDPRLGSVLASEIHAVSREAIETQRLEAIKNDIVVLRKRKSSFVQESRLYSLYQRSGGNAPLDELLDGVSRSIVTDLVGTVTREIDGAIGDVIGSCLDEELG